MLNELLHKLQSSAFMRSKQTAVLITAVLISFSILFFVKILSNAFIYADDTDSLILQENGGFLKSIDGFFTSGVLGNFFGAYLPYKLSMHPSYFRGMYFSYIEALCLTGFVLMLSNLLYRRLSLVYPAVFLFSCSSLLFFLKEHPYMLYTYEGFFRILLSIFIWVLFFISFRKYVELKNNAFLFSSAIAAFLSCISGEFSCFITIAGISFYYLICALKKDFKIKDILIFAVSFLAGLAVMKYTGGFTRKASFFQNIPDMAALLKDFAPDYIKYVFFKHITAYIILTMQLIILNFKYKEEKIQQMSKFCLCSLIAVFMFFAALIFLGKTHYEPGRFWLIHQDLHVMYSVVLCSFNFALFNIFTEKNPALNYIFAVFAFIAAAAMLSFNLKFFYEHSYSIIKPLRIETYKAEKMIRTAACEGKTAYLPKSMLDNPAHWAFYLSDSKAEPYLLYNSKSAPYINYLNIFQKDNKLDLDFMFTDDEKAEEEFRNNGGEFTEDELKKTDFNSLYYICR